MIVKYSKKIFLLLICVFFLSLISAGKIACPGIQSAHLQGIASDEDKNIYWSFTTDLIKTDVKGKILLKIAVPRHHGDLAYYDGKVYVAVNLGKFNREKGDAKSWVYVYDAKNLKLISKHGVPEVVHGAGGMEYYKGHFFVVGGLPEGHKANYVYEYDENFKFLKKHIIDGYTVKGIQAVCHSHGHWWFGCYGKPNVVLKTDDSFKLIGKYNFNCSMGISSFSDDSLLVGRTNGHYHKGKVLFAKPDKTKGLVVLKH